jgi:hypothetical protein
VRFDIENARSLLHKKTESDIAGKKAGSKQFYFRHKKKQPGFK